MTSVLFGFGFSLFTALVVIFGDYFIKIAADSGGSSASSRLLLLGCLLYAGSALLWYVSLQHIGLAQAGVAFSMFTLIALALLGALLFDEPLYGREVAGIGCALIAMVLMVRIG